MQRVKERGREIGIPHFSWQGTAPPVLRWSQLSPSAPVQRYPPPERRGLLREEFHGYRRRRERVEVDDSDGEIKGKDENNCMTCTNVLRAGGCRVTIGLLPSFANHISQTLPSVSKHSL